jgi:hypothetical protein
MVSPTSASPGTVPAKVPSSGELGERTRDLSDTSDASEFFPRRSTPARFITKRKRAETYRRAKLLPSATVCDTNS